MNIVTDKTIPNLKSIIERNRELMTVLEGESTIIVWLFSTNKLKFSKSMYSYYYYIFISLLSILINNIENY